jgi:hypothetical protein
MFVNAGKTEQTIFISEGSGPLDGGLKNGDVFKRRSEAEGHLGWHQPLMIKGQRESFYVRVDLRSEEIHSPATFSNPKMTSINTKRVFSSLISKSGQQTLSGVVHRSESESDAVRVNSCCPS